MNNILTKSDKPPAQRSNAEKVRPVTTTERGRSAEDRALAYLMEQGLQVLARNYKTPGRGGGEIDLVMRQGDGTVIFVEVRLRQSQSFGGAAASVGSTKQRRLVLAAHRYLMRYRQLPPCRFDVLSLEPHLQWIKAAFDAGSFYRG